MTRRLLLMGLFALAACKGNVLVDKGNAFNCSFGLNDDTQCPSGYRCAVDGVCREYTADTVSANPSIAYAPELAFPRQLAGGIQVTAAESTRAGIGFLVTADDRVFLATRTDLTYLGDAGAEVNAIAASGNNAVFIVQDPASIQTLTGTFDAQGTFRAIVDGASKLPITEGFALRSAPLRANGSSKPIVYVQRWARGVLTATGEIVYPPLPSQAPEFRALMIPLDGGFEFALDARPVNRSDLEFSNQFSCDPLPDGGVRGIRENIVPVAVGSGGLFYRQCVSLLPWLDTWASLSTPQEPLDLPIDASGANQPPQLRVDRTGSVFAIAYAPVPDPSPRLKGLSVLRLNRSPIVPPTVTRAFNDCRPCSEGDSILAAAPTLISGSAAVDVVCARVASDGGASLNTRRVTGSAGTGITDSCDFAPLTPSFELDEVWRERARGGLPHVAVNDTPYDGTVVSGKHGQVWAGEALDSLQPLYLDRVPDEVGSLMSRPFALTGKYVALPSDGGVFTVIFPEELSGSPERPLTPMSVANDPTGTLAGWVVLSTSDLAKLVPDTDGGSLKFAAQYGSQLLDASGRPARGPYAFDVADFGGTVQSGPDKQFAVTAFDSFYITPRTLTAERGQLPPLTPAFTPQPGAAIRSMVIDRSTEHTEPQTGEGTNKSVIQGYLVASNTLFTFALRTYPTRGWTFEAVKTGDNEPIRVWMQTPSSPHGRAGFRDGRVLSLPSGFPLMKPINPATRVIDFVNFGGVPVALAESGLFFATSKEGGEGAWEPRPLPADFDAFDGGSNMQLRLSRLFVVPEGANDVLYLFAPHGLVYRLASVAR